MWENWRHARTSPGKILNEIDVYTPPRKSDWFECLSDTVAKRIKMVIQVCPRFLRCLNECHGPYKNPSWHRFAGKNGLENPNETFGKTFAHEKPLMALTDLQNHPSGRLVHSMKMVTIDCVDETQWWDGRPARSPCEDLLGDSLEISVRSNSIQKWNPALCRTMCGSARKWRNSFLNRIL